MEALWIDPPDKTGESALGSCLVMVLLGVSPVRNQYTVPRSRFCRTAMRGARPMLLVTVAMMTSIPLPAQVTLHPFWTVREDLDATEFSTGLATDGLVVFTFGTSDPYPYGDCLNQVYNDVGSALTDAQLWSVTGGEVVVLVAGSGVDATGSQVFEVQSFDEFSGRLRWNNECQAPGGLGSTANATAVQGNMVFAGGVVTTGPNLRQNDNRAYSLSTAALVWQDRSPAGGFFDLATSGATPAQDALLRAQLRLMDPDVLPSRIVFVPHWKYLDDTRVMHLPRLPTGYTSAMFTHLPSRTVFIDAGRYIDGGWLGYWMAHELGHLATNSVSEDDAERAAKKFRMRLKAAR